MSQRPARDHTESGLLTPGEVAARLGVARETVARWRRDGEVPFLQTPGGAIRYRVGEIEAIAAGLRSEAAR